MWVSDSVPHTENETHTPSYTRRAILATKIRLKRMGKKFYAFYRVVIMDSRTCLLYTSDAADERG